MNPPLRNKGFTLVEVLIGLIILAIGILAIAGMQITSTRGNFFSSNLMQASYVAQDRLEYLKDLNFTKDAAIQGGSSTKGSQVISGVVFNWSDQIVGEDVRRITVTVTWNDGVDHNVSFSTIRSQ